MNLKQFSLMALAVLSSPVFANDLQSLENMERERAGLVATLRASELEASARQAKLQVRQARLVDLERMTLRDDRLLGHQHRLVRLTFNDYDMSFLVHAAAEAGVAPVEHWMSELGFDTTSILNTRVGRR